MTDNPNEPTRRNIAGSDRILDTQALRLPKEFIEENKATRQGPLVEKPILIVFLLALAFLALIAFLVSRS
jgi:hypothetical protein